MKKRRAFTAEFKREAVRLVRERGLPVARAAPQIDVHENVLRKWVKEFETDPAQAFPGRGKMKPERAEIERLRREVARLKMERDFLQKSRRLLRKGIELRFGFVASHRGIWPVTVLCETLGVSRAGYYQWLVRPPSRRVLRDARALAAIRRSFADSDETYGARRVWLDLRAWQVDCGRGQIERLMRRHELVAKPVKRQLPVDSGVRPEHGIAPNALARQFDASGPNQRWVADFTYIWTLEGWLYLAVVLDLFSRRVIGRSMQPRMTSDLVSDALLMAIWRRGWPTELLHHSDQGSQYTSDAFQRLLRDHGIQCSMGRRGECWTNAAMESFFATLKRERVHRRVYHTRDEAKADLFDYIEGFYNPRRRHSTLGGISPKDFEEKTELV